MLPPGDLVSDSSNGVSHAASEKSMPATRPPIGSTFYTSSDAKHAQKKRARDEGLVQPTNARYSQAPTTSAPDSGPHVARALPPIGAPRTKSRRIGAAANGRSAASGSASAVSNGHAFSQVGNSEEQRLTRDIQEASAGVLQAMKSVSMPEIMR